MVYLQASHSSGAGSGAEEQATAVQAPAAGGGSRDCVGTNRLAGFASLAQEMTLYSTAKKPVEVVIYCRTCNVGCQSPLSSPV